jgi:Na+/melibiose symporter-like transporter
LASAATGLSSAIYSIIQTVCVGLANGIFNLMLGVTGYVPPSVVDGVTVAAAQSDATKGVFIFFFLVLDIITSVVIVVLLSRLNVEKTIKQEQEEIKARHQGATAEKTTTTEEA